jgi:molecular chaperone DnaK (HSP70)
MDAALHRVVGIDLGTTYSAVAAYDEEEYSPKILTDPGREGSAAIAMPSVVRLDAATGTLLIGHDAKDAIAGGADAAVDTVLEIKREMGRSSSTRPSSSSSARPTTGRSATRCAPGSAAGGCARRRSAPWC